VQIKIESAAVWTNRAETPNVPALSASPCQTVAADRSVNQKAVTKLVTAGEAPDQDLNTPANPRENRAFLNKAAQNAAHLAHRRRAKMQHSLNSSTHGRICRLR